MILTKKLFYITQFPLLSEKSYFFFSEEKLTAVITFNNSLLFEASQQSPWTYR